MTAALDLADHLRISRAAVVALTEANAHAEKRIEEAEGQEASLRADLSFLRRELAEERHSHAATLRARDEFHAALASERSAHAGLEVQLRDESQKRAEAETDFRAEQAAHAETRRQLEEAHRAIQEWNHCACDICDDCLERFETAAPDAITSRAREAQGTGAAK